jgi:hypothetical protein
MFWVQTWWVVLIGGGILMCFHISYRVTAQIRLYSIVQGNRYGLDFCTNMPTMLVLEQR